MIKNKDVVETSKIQFIELWKRDVETLKGITGLKQVFDDALNKMKKGESAITFVFSLIFLAIVITIFYALFLLSSVNKANFSINQVSLSDVNINLINYLRTPLNTTTVYDLMINSYYNNDYRELETLSENIFNRVYDNERCPLWNIKGEINNEKFFEFESKFDARKYTLSQNPRNFLRIFTDDYLATRSSSFDIVFPDNKKAKITLLEGCVE